MSWTNPHFYKTIPCKRGGQSFNQQKDEKVMLSGYIEGRILPYSSLVMLISRKLTKDKRVVTHFRHLNVRIVKNNLAYPLPKDIFSVLGSYKCKFLSILDLKDVFHFFRLSENSKKYTLVFWQCIIPISEDAYGIKHIPLHMAILHQCYPWLFREHEILWSH